MAGLIGTFTGAKAMVVQDYLAVKSHKEVLEAEIDRERYEMEKLLELERKEIEDINKEKGFDGKELKMIVEVITSDKSRWLKTMLVEELGLNLEVAESPLRNALVMFLSFIIGGIIPIVPYLGLDVT